MKQTDEKYKRYRFLLPKIRYVKKVGLNDKNSFCFYSYIDEIVPLIEYVKKFYNMKPSKETLSFIYSFQ